ncbi:MAG: class IV adenylate cyclase [Bacteroidota bacterium]|jgi:predicted adenylyl cyclase CyaB
MPQNLELKARISSVSEALHTAHRLKAQAKGILQQRDIYYKVSRGRLKLRISNGGSAELIFYNRPNKKGSRYSDYFVLPIDDAIRTNALCTAAFRQKVVVEKKRRLFLYKNSRIHLDEVRGLGTFIEFEVLVRYGIRQAQKLLEVLSTEFAIKQTAILAFSYSDMLLQKK